MSFTCIRLHITIFIQIQPHKKKDTPTEILTADELLQNEEFDPTIENSFVIRFPYVNLEINGKVYKMLIDPGARY